MKTCTLLTLALAAASTPLLGQTLPTPIFQDDFSTPGTPDASKWNVYRASGTGAPISTQKYIHVTTDNSPFGEGNGYLRIHHETGAGGLWVANTALPANQVLTVAFDFYMPSQTAWGTTNNGLDPRVRLGSGDPVQSNNNRVHNELHFNDGGVGKISEQPDPGEALFATNTLHSIIWVYNHSLETTTYANSSRTLESGRYDVWLNGSLVIPSHADPLHPTNGWIGRALGTDMTSVAFGAIGRQTEFYIDNFAVYAGAIPEPSTYALGAGLLALGAAAFWRRRRAA